MKIWECGICKDLFGHNKNKIYPYFNHFVKIPTFYTGAKDFRHQYTLLRHLPTHTDERKFVCDYCNKAFRQVEKRFS